MKIKFVLLFLLIHILVSCKAQKSFTNNNNKKDVRFNEKQGNRIALIVGCSNYKYDFFANGENDAELIMQTLKKVHFEVDILKNAKYSEILNGIDKFLLKLRLNETQVGLLYFVGDGFQIEGENYYIPIDRPERKRDTIHNFISISSILDQFVDLKRKFKIVILDIPRFNPMKDKRESHLYTSLPSETVLLYSTAPSDSTFHNSKSMNSIFATELSKAILTPNINIDEMFKIMFKKVNEQSHKIHIPGFGYAQKRQTPYFLSNYRKNFKFVK